MLMRLGTTTIRGLSDGVPSGSLVAVVARLARVLRAMSGDDGGPRPEAPARTRTTLPATWEMVAVAALIIALSLAGVVLVRLETSTLGPTRQAVAPAGGRPTPCGAAATTRPAPEAPPTIGARFAC
jgi:hypothetical protein